ncbi:MAG TPA: 16S rRNA (cytidine(1402)-2'-O)-methyltransferase [Bacteroidota bacterium]|nr:16S rRNA (cytidine(1402)-2'-O)-methyltransferase [Bacteroidota bacterium]
MERIDLLNNASSGILYIVSTPIGNLEDISFRALNILSNVDRIACEDTRKTAILLNHYNIHKPLISYYSYNEVRRVPDLIEKLLQGSSIALVTDAGTPGISDPATILVREALAKKIKIVPIPGASALLAAIIVSGFSIDSFVFEGFLPHKKGRQSRLEELRSETRTIVIYESPHRLFKTLQQLYDVLGDRQIAVCRELTKKFEEVIRGRLSVVLKELKNKTPRGEYVLVIEGKEK